MNLKAKLTTGMLSSIAQQYARAAQLPLLVLDGSGNTLHCLAQDEFRAQFEIMENLGDHFREWCARVADNSFRWGDAYFTTTPIGTVVFSIPVVDSDAHIGAFVSGFAAFPETAGDVAADARKALAGLKMECDEAAIRALRVKILTKHQVRYFADLLMKVLDRSGMLDRSALREKREKTAQQLDIADFIKQAKKTGRDVADSIISMQEEIIFRVKRGDIRGAKALLNEYLGCIFLDTGMNFDMIKIRIIELIVLMSRSAIDLGAGSSELLRLNQEYLARLNDTDDYESLCHAVVKILEHFIARIDTIMIDRKRMRVRLMLDYIGRHFSGRIAASSVAEAAGLSVSRALHLLREESGASFQEHVARHRVNYGKFLLLHSDDSIAQIALQSGFYDCSQFTRTFRAQERTTPGKFRKMFKA
jgi:two-component system response regulator YesN